MLLQVSGRTDICALYPKWFVNRLKAGYILVRNPYNEHQVSHVDVTPEVVDCICFCWVEKNDFRLYDFTKFEYFHV